MTEDLVSSLIGPVHARDKTRGFVYYSSDDVTGAHTPSLTLSLVLHCSALKLGVNHTSPFPIIYHPPVYTLLAICYMEASSFTYKYMMFIHVALYWRESSLPGCRCDED